MRKALVVAAREYNAAVRTKTFVIGLLMMPLLMGGSILLQVLLRDAGGDKPRPIAVIDRTPGEQVFPVLEAQVKAVDKEFTGLRSGEAKSLGRYRLERVDPGADDPESVAQLRFELSERVRKGELFGVLEIGRDVFRPAPLSAEVPAGEAPKPPDERRAVRVQSNRAEASDFVRGFAAVVNGVVQQARAREAGLPPEKLAEIKQPVPVLSRGLTRPDARTGKLEDASEQSRIAAFAVPFGLIMVAFAVLMMTATPLMQSVLEEKMQRIAEVLLGSVPPFQLMLGKLLGMAAVSFTIAAVYLGGAYWLAWYYGMAEFVAPELLGWFAVFQPLATLMFGALFIAVGAACNDMKETQNLLWPVMLLAVFPMFLLGPLLQDAHGPAMTAVSFFPFATPTLMLARQAMPPGVPLWQPLVGAALVLATTVACVWAAGRIFRVGLLAQGQGAGYAQMIRWVIRG